MRDIETAMTQPYSRSSLVGKLGYSRIPLHHRVAKKISVLWLLWSRENLDRIRLNSYDDETSGLNRYRVFFLVFSSVLAVSALWLIWQCLGTHLPCCDANQYGRMGAAYRDVGLWKDNDDSDLRTFGFPFYLFLFGGELSPDTAWGATSSSLFLWNTVFFVLASWFFVISAARIGVYPGFPKTTG